MTTPKRLSQHEIQFYRDNGYLSPVRVMSAQEAKAYRAKLEAFESGQGKPLTGQQRARTYLLFSWAYEILTRPEVLVVVEDLFGPDIMVYHWTR